MLPVIIFGWRKPVRPDTVKIRETIKVEMQIPSNIPFNMLNKWGCCI